MATKKDLCQASNGLFVRNLGWKLTSEGKYTQHKFYLGRDGQAARLASLRLEKLWGQLSARWERDNPNELYPTDRPIWDQIGLVIAEAVRKGEAVAKVPLPIPYSAMVPESLLTWEWLDTLQNDVTIIKIELEDKENQGHTEKILEDQGQRLVEMGKRMLRRRSGGDTLFSAMDAYSKWIGTQWVDVEKRTTPWGGMQIRQVAFMKRHLRDCLLTELDSQKIEEDIDLLRMRPKGQEDRAVSVTWARNCIKQYRHFLRWLNKTPTLEWKRPSDLDFSPVRIPLFPSEKSVLLRSSQVQTHTQEELKILWKYASPFQRLLFLLSLNCGFGRAEIASLDISDVHFNQRHPHEREIGLQSCQEDSWIFRIRQKTGVYGEFKLWPETVMALKWWLRQREQIALAETCSTLLINRKGQRFDARTKGNHANFQIPNSWLRLLDQIEKDHPGFRRLSFNKLRKTAGNLIRQEAGGEVAGVFLCHGTPVRDQLIDAYTNRPFPKVFAAIDAIGSNLRPLWTGVSDPFPDSNNQGGPNISLGKIQSIQSLIQQGFKTGHVAKTLGVSPGTVRRWAKRQAN